MLAQTIFKQESGSSLLMLLRYLLCLGLGFLAGYSVEHRHQELRSNEDTFDVSFSKGSENSMSAKDHLSFSETPSPSKTVMENVQYLSGKEYACNTQGAFEELSILHARRLELERRKKNGEANRDRTATIARKYGNSLSAESSFRLCVQKMIPELLNSWDTALEHNEISLKSPSKHKKESNEINIDVLRETAESLENYLK
jgi:hypothetical protein